MRFAHLHCHSDHSFLDGVGRSIEYAELAAEHKHVAIACTDHGNLHGLPEHRRACERYGVKAVHGCELYVNDLRDQTKEIKTRARDEKLDTSMIDPTASDAHLVVLCESDAGWKNLLAINHDSVRHGFYYKPRTTHDLVCSHAEGLFASTACVASLFSRFAHRGDIKRLDHLLRQFKDAFGDRFYREVHINELLGGTDKQGRDIPDQRKINAILRERCERLDIPAVLVNDVHYACNADADRQDEMIAVARRGKVNDPKAFSLTARHLAFANPKDIYELQKKWGYGYTQTEIADWCLASADIADRCTADIYGDGSLRPPRFQPDEPGVTDANVYLARLAKRGFAAKRGLVPDPAKYGARLKYEFGVVKKLGLADFFLVTWDVVRFCRSKGIRVWTRGSGCASLLAAVIDITPIDPMRFGLLFERFMDPDRPSPPDFDLDIDASRREEVIDWFVAKYGGPDGDRIARVCSIQTYGLRSALRDVLSSRGVDPSIAGRLAATTEYMEPAVGFPVPKAERVLADSTLKTRKAAVDAAYTEIVDKCAGDLKAWCDSNEPLVKDALVMVGRAKGKTLHAAGFVVAPTPLVEHMPIDRATSESKQKVITTAWGEGQASQDIGPTGLLKIDFLGLETVAVVDAAVRLASRRHGRDVDAEINGWTIPWTDPKAIAELKTGNGVGLHQLNSHDQALAGFVRDLRPTSVDDLVAAVAAYRPGSLDHLDEFIARARGREATPSVDRVVDDITRETHGVLIYQEQIMLILHRLGGIPLREAYGIIKAISKKDEAKIRSAEAKFVAGVVARSKSLNLKDGPALAKRVWGDVYKFAGYGFNKAHSASYGALGYITAYLRGHYPLEFWWAWLSRMPNTAKGKGQDKVRRCEPFMRAARSRGIKIMRPRVGLSSSAWRVTKGGGLLAPLSLVVGVGDAAADSIAEAYRLCRWPDLYGFLEWAETHGRVVNSRAIVSLAMGGAFAQWCDTAFAYDAANLYAAVKASKKHGSRAAQVRDAMINHADQYRVTVPDTDTDAVFESRAYGFVFWHDAWERDGRRDLVRSLMHAGRIVPDDRSRDREVGRRAFCVRGLRKHVDKRGRKMAFLDLEGVDGRNVRGVVFSSVYNSVSLTVGRVYLMRGEFDREGGYLLTGGGNPAMCVDDFAGAGKGAVA